MIIIAPWWIASVNMTAQFALLGLGVCGIAMWWFVLVFGRRRHHLFPYLAFPVILGLILVGCQMLPLHDVVQQAVARHQSDLYAGYASPAPGELFVDSETSRLESPTRTTMDLDGSIRTFNLLMLALICMMLGAHFFSSRRGLILLPLIATLNGVVISFFGIVQKLKFDGRLFWFIELRYGGVPFGPFVNRNNAAGFLLICFGCSLMLIYLAFTTGSRPGGRPRPIITDEYPIWRRLGLHLALFFSELNGRKLAAILASVIILAGIVGTLSRGGTVALLLGYAAVFAFVVTTRKSRSLVILFLASGLLAIALIGWLGMSASVAERLDTLSDTDILSNETRVQHWLQTAPAIGDFVPLGSGAGSYVHVHRLYRVDSEERIFYHAENQYFQTLVETGWLGFLLLASAIVLVLLSIRFLAVRGNSPRSSAVVVLALFVITSQSVAALFDFGLYIPANAVMMATICGFIVGQAHALADRLKKKFVFRFNLSHLVTLLLLLAIFSAGLFSTLTAYRLARCDRAMGETAVRDTYRTLPLSQTNQRIDALLAAVASQPTADGFARLGELWIHRFRLRLFQALTATLPTGQSSNPEVLDQYWTSTSIDRLHDMVFRARQANDPDRVQQLQQDPLVRENLLKAIFYLKQSRQRSPLQPNIHLLLGQLHCLSPLPEADQYHLARARELAPANSLIWFVSGLLELQAGRVDLAKSTLRRCLQISPRFYKQVVQATWPILSPEQIFRDILPESPVLLFDFAKTRLDTESTKALKSEVFARVEQILDEGRNEDRKSLEIKAEVQISLGKIDAAIKTKRLTTQLYPQIAGYRFQLAELLMQNGQLDLAWEEIRWLMNRYESKVRYRQLYQKIQKLRQERDFPGL